MWCLLFLCDTHSWFPQGRRGPSTHVFRQRSAAALLLPGLIYVSPRAAAAWGYWEQMRVSRPVAAGSKRALAVFPYGLPLLFPLTESGLLEFQNFLGLLSFKNKWKEDPIVLISMRKMRGERLSIDLPSNTSVSYPN